MSTVLWFSSYVPMQGIIQKFNLGVGSHVSITLMPPTQHPPTSCFAIYHFQICSYETPFLLTIYSSFSVLHFSLNVLLPYSSQLLLSLLLPYKNCLFLLSLKTQQRCMPTEPGSQCFFPNAEQLIGEEIRPIALRQERRTWNKIDAHKDHGKMISYWQCVNAFKSARYF